MDKKGQAKINLDSGAEKTSFLLKGDDVMASLTRKNVREINFD